MDNNYFIIHGSFGSPFVNWFSWLYKELDSKGNQVIAPQFPVGVGLQNYENWSKLLHYYKDLGLINENTVFIAHSIAPVFVAKFLIENKIKVVKLIFVSGFNNVFGIAEDYDKVNESMYADNIELAHNFCNNIICLYSNNDPYLKFEYLEEFASKVADKKEIIQDGGHLNSEFGYDKFEVILKYL